MMEVNPCKKCGRPVSVHAEYCPYCGAVVDRRPFVPASQKKPVSPSSSEPAGTFATDAVAPGARKPQNKVSTPASVAQSPSHVTPMPDAADVARLCEEQAPETVATSATSTPKVTSSPSAAQTPSRSERRNEPPVPPAAPHDDEERPSSGSGIKWALLALCIIVVACAAGGYYYYENYLNAPAQEFQTPVVGGDTAKKVEEVPDNEAELRADLLRSPDVYAKRAGGLIIQYSNAQLRKMLEIKHFVHQATETADGVNADGDAQPDRMEVYELKTNKGVVLCRMTLHDDRVFNELWFKYDEDKAAFLRSVSSAGFRQGRSAEAESKDATYYSSFVTDSIATRPNMRHDYIVDSVDGLILYRERER